MVSDTGNAEGINKECWSTIQIRIAISYRSVYEERREKIFNPLLRCLSFRECDTMKT